MAALVPVTLHMLSNTNWSLCLNSCPIVEGWALICTTFSGQTLLSLGYSQKHCAWCDCQARGGAWSQYTQLLLTPSALVIQARLGRSGSPATAALNTSLGRIGAITPFSSPSSSGQSFSSICYCLPAFLSTPFSFLFFQQGCGKNRFSSPSYFLEHKLLLSIFHHKQGGWTGKVLRFSLSFSTLYSMRSWNKWAVTRADKGLEARPWL